MMPFAKIDVESRRSFYPFPLQIKFYKTVINKKITPYEFNELFCGKMISDIGKPYTRWNSTSPSQSTKEGGLRNTETPTTFEHIACTIMLRQIKRRIRIIKDAIAYGKIKLHGDLYRVYHTV
jgi:hypothetical protein